MEKKKKPIYKRKWFIGLMIFLALGAIGSLNDENKNNETKPTEVASTEATDATQATDATEVEPQTMQEKLDAIGKEVYRDNYIKTNFYWDEENAVFQENGDYDEEKTPIDFINVTVKLPDGFSDKGDVNSFLNYSSSYLKGIKDLNYRAVFIGAEAQLQDKYGKVRTEYVVKMELDKTEVDKINFDNFLPENLPSIAREYWTSNALKLDK